jgi:hypothetical protein
MAVLPAVAKHLCNHRAIRLPALLRLVVIYREM